MSNQNVNVTRFARNIEWDFFCDFQTLCLPAGRTLFEIFIFCPKIQLWFPENFVDFFRWKTRENVLVLDFLALDNFDFTRKIAKKNFGEKLVKMLGFVSKLNFWTKIWLFEWCEDHHGYNLFQNFLLLTTQQHRVWKSLQKCLIFGAKKSWFFLTFEFAPIFFV